MKSFARVILRRWTDTLVASIVAASTLAAAPAGAQSLNSTSVGRPAGPYTPVPQQATANDGLHRLIVSNDLGMHCAGFDARILSILPPFNTVHAQVLTKGLKPTLLDDTTISVEYSAAANPNDPALAKAPVLATNGSVYKTNFWSATSGYASLFPPNILSPFFPTSPQRTDIGLPTPNVDELYLGDGKLTFNQQTMPSVTSLTVNPTTHVPTALTSHPYASNSPQPFRVFEASYPLFDKLAFGYVANKTNWFAAEGIPISAFDDAGRENPFSLMRIVARSKTTNAALVSADTVVPVSGETNCKTCHLPSPYGNGLATSKVSAPKIPPNDPMANKVPAWVRQEWAADVNILALHDQKHGTKLNVGYSVTTGLSPKPVVCQTCHYSPALDLAQLGPQNANGLQQASHESMSRVMHYGHGVLTSNGAPIFPTMPPPTDSRRVSAVGGLTAFTQSRLQATCYQCHPGQRTQCLRGVMFNKAGAICQDCHGQMTQVGNDFSRNLPTGGFIVAGDFYKNANTPRVPWANEPTCGSCHTGDAVSNMTGATGAIKASDSIRLLQAYLSTDSKATPIVPTNLRFAEPKVASGTATGNPQLYRLSVDSHGGVFCEGCHGATHAEWPNANAAANDNVAATQIQGHAGKIMECDACHTGSLGTTLAGPHGMHPVGNSGYSANWVGSHGDFVDGRGGNSTCKACHGQTLQGSVLAVVATDRTGLRCESGSACVSGHITLKAGAQVTCITCHSSANGN